MKTRKIVSIILTFMLVLVMSLSNIALASDGGKTIAITVTPPSAGARPDYYPTISGVEYYSSRAYWEDKYENGSSFHYADYAADYSFKYDDENIFHLDLYNDTSPTYFDSVTSVTVNGVSVEFIYDSASNSESWIGIQYSFGSMKRTSIKDIYLEGYQPLKIGMSPIQLTPAKGYPAQYKGYGRYGVSDSYGDWHDVTEFVEGNKYNLFIPLEAASDDYDFKGFDKSGLHILYKDGELDTTDASIFHYDNNMIVISFPVFTLEANALDINCQITAPKAGKTPATTATVPADAAYNCTGIDWYVNDQNYFSSATLMTPGQTFELGNYYFAKPHFSYDTNFYDRDTLTVNNTSCPDKYYEFGLLRKNISANLTFKEPSPGSIPPASATVPSGSIYSVDLQWYEIQNNDLSTARKMTEGEKIKAGYYYAAVPIFKIDWTKYGIAKVYLNGKEQLMNSEYFYFGPIQKIAQKVNAKSSYSLVIGTSLTLKPGTSTKTTYKTSNKNVATVSSKGVIKITGIGSAKITVSAAESSIYKKAAKTITVTGIPKTAVIASLTSGKRYFTVKMKTMPSKLYATNYQVAYRLKGQSKWKTATTKAQSLTIKKLTKGKQYYVKVRAYRKVGTKTYYGAWTAAKLSKKIK